MSCPRRDSKAFHTPRDPAAEKLLSPKLVEQHGSSQIRTEAEGGQYRQ